MTGRALPTFTCEVLHSKLTVAGCVALYRKRDDLPCPKCPVGVEHAAGRSPTHWPATMTVSGPILRSDVEPYDRIPSRKKRKAR